MQITAAWGLGWSVVFASLAKVAMDAHALTWTALGWGTLVLLLIGGLLRCLLVSTQSEHSTPAAKLKPKASGAHSSIPVVGVPSKGAVDVDDRPHKE